MKLDQIMEKTEILTFKMFDDKDTIPDVDIAFIEGSISTNSDVLELELIRKKSKLLVELGSCANLGRVASELSRTERTEQKNRAHRSMALIVHYERQQFSQTNLQTTRPPKTRFPPSPVEAP